MLFRFVQTLYCIRAMGHRRISVCVRSRLRLLKVFKNQMVQARPRLCCGIALCLTRARQKVLCVWYSELLIATTGADLIVSDTRKNNCFRNAASHPSADFSSAHPRPTSRRTTDHGLSRLSIKCILTPRFNPAPPGTEGLASATVSIDESASQRLSAVISAPLTAENAERRNTDGAQLPPHTAPEREESPGRAALALRSISQRL